MNGQGHATMLTVAAGNARCVPGGPVAPWFTTTPR